MNDKEKTKLLNSLYSRLVKAVESSSPELQEWWARYVKRVAAEGDAASKKIRAVAPIIKHTFEPIPPMESTYIFDTPVSEYMAQAIAMKHGDVIKGYIAAFDASDFMYHVVNPTPPDPTVQSTETPNE